MFQINNHVKLNIKQFLILLIIIFTLFLLYNKLYINTYFLPISKYKSMSKKYKNIIHQFQLKLNETEQKLQLPILSPNPPSNSTSNPNTLNNTINIPTNEPVYVSKNDDDVHLINSIDTYLSEQQNTNIYNQPPLHNPLHNPSHNPLHSQINGFDTIWRGSSYATL